MKDHYFTHEEAQLLVNYSTGALSTAGKSKLSWKEFCEELQHSGGGVHGESE